MVEGYCFEYSSDEDVKQIKSILEPSAGKGDIVKYLKDFAYRVELDIDCIEANPILRAVLKDKKYRVVHDDFLSYRTHKKYDLIIMNPPFDNGDKHLLKALDMQKDGGCIACLLNAETIKNLYTNSRKELYERLKELDADIEFIEDGFIDAERKTGVEVALIKVKIPDKYLVCDILEKLKCAEKVEEVEITEEQKSELISTDFIEFLKLLITRYNTEMKMGIEFIKEYYAMSPYILKYIGEKSFNKPILELEVKDKYDENLINSFVREVRYKYWYCLLNNKELVGKLTYNEQCKYIENINKLVDYELSIFNILTIKEEIEKDLMVSIEQTILNLFDELSYKHYYDETSKNVHYYNGWRTNKCYKINNKVIIPFYSYCNIFNKFDCYKATDFMNDMTKVLDYLDCGRTNFDYGIDFLIKSSFNMGVYKNICLKYFDVTFYKKGTCHITFTNQELLDKLNLFGSQRKGWLPPNYGKKAYSDMDAEEQAVVQEFSGSIENYNKIYNDQQYYIVDKKLLLSDGAFQQIK